MNPIPLPLSWEIGTAELSMPDDEDPSRVVLKKLVVLAINTPMGGPLVFYFDADSAERAGEQLVANAATARTKLDIASELPFGGATHALRNTEGVVLEQNRQERRGNKIHPRGRKR